MQVTKEEQLQIRRARVAAMYAEGAVMTDSLRKKMQKEAKRLARIQELAERELARSNRISSVPMGTVTEVVIKAPAPVANVKLKSTLKVDKLAAAADSIIRELQSV